MTISDRPAPAASAAHLLRLRASGPLGELLARQGQAHGHDYQMNQPGRLHAALPGDLPGFHHDPVLSGRWLISVLRSMPVVPDPAMASPWWQRSQGRREGEAMHVQPSGTPAPQGRHRGSPAVMMHLARASAHRAGGSKAAWITAAVLGAVLVAMALVAWLILH